MVKANILVLGAYGLIGAAVSRHLLEQGHHITGLGRNRETATKVLPQIDWVIRDIATLHRKANWAPLLEGITHVINCSGALQDGPEDDLEAVHHHAIAALAEACASQDIHLIQISAVGAEPEAPTQFMASKARGDAAIRASGAGYTLLRPGLVLDQSAYGGTMLLRMLAAIPWVQPMALPDARLQTVGTQDLTRVIAACVDGTIPAGTELDVVEDQAHTLGDIADATRHWLGFASARHMGLPDWLTGITARIADGLSRLGWRSPLRSTAMQVLRNGVTGTPPNLDRFRLTPVAPMAESFAALPAGSEHRLQARMALLMPMMIITLSLFWLLSGVIGALRVGEAAEVLTVAGWPQGLAVASVLFWAVVDIAIGVGFAIRRFAKAACWAAVLVSLFYLAASTLFVPALWVDPLGPLVKVIPGITLALVARVALESR